MKGEQKPQLRTWPVALELDTYLPPVVIISLGRLGNDASSEPQVSADVQSPQSLLVPKSYTDRL